MNSLSSTKKNFFIYHILVKHQYEAEDLLKKIKGDNDFKSCALRFSLCPSAKHQGLLGPYKKGRYVEAFEEAVEALQIGQISSPVRTPFGYHLILLLES